MIQNNKNPRPVGQIWKQKTLFFAPKPSKKDATPAKNIQLDHAADTDSDLECENEDERREKSKEAMKAWVKKTKEEIEKYQKEEEEQNSENEIREKELKNNDKFWND